MSEGEITTLFFLRRAYFAGIKSYCLEPWDENSSLEVRSKGVARSVRNLLTKEHFLVDNSRRVFFENMTLSPTVGGEISLIKKTRQMNSVVNMKRQMDPVREGGRMRRRKSNV